jgi:branched-chain amino acid transport system ATP-binding protein
VTGPPTLATRGLGLDIGGATIVADVGLEVREGEFLGIIGPNGAGKTSLFNLLTGVYRATSGTIELAGEDITHTPPYRRTQLGLGRTFQISNVFPRLTALENVRLAADASLGGTTHIWRRALSVRQAIDKARSALARVGLGDRELWPAGALAHGDKRKLELAMILAGDPHVVLLDEPMAGISIEEMPGLVDVIKSVQEQEGKTVLMVEHHIHVVTGVADRIAVMHHGALLACDTPDRVMADETVQSAYLGEPL